MAKLLAQPAEACAWKQFKFALCREMITTTITTAIDMTTATDIIAADMGATDTGVMTITTGDFYV